MTDPLLKLFLFSILLGKIQKAKQPYKIKFEFHGGEYERKKFITFLSSYSDPYGSTFF